VLTGKVGLTVLLGALAGGAATVVVASSFGLLDMDAQSNYRSVKPETNDIENRTDVSVTERIYAAGNRTPSSESNDSLVVSTTSAVAQSDSLQGNRGGTFQPNGSR
jgi:hypothetical protein